LFRLPDPEIVFSLKNRSRTDSGKEGWTMSLNFNPPCPSRHNFFNLLVLAINFLDVFHPSISSNRVSVTAASRHVTYPSGAVVGGAKITSRRNPKGRHQRDSDRKGTYSSGAFIPGVHRESGGFRVKTTEVFRRRASGQHRQRQREIGTRPGQSNSRVEAQYSWVNTEQGDVQGVITESQIETCR